MIPADHQVLQRFAQVELAERQAGAQVQGDNLPVGQAGERQCSRRRDALHPAAQRHLLGNERPRGIADALATYALDWIEGLGCRRAVVNTSVTNVAALALYRRHAFTELPERLVVAESEPFGPGT